MKKFNLEEVKEYIRNSSMESTIFLGCDSERTKENGKWFADHAVVVAIHIDDSHGCKVFGYIEREVDYDQKVNRPFNRLMSEALKVCELYEKLKDVIFDRKVEVHLDLNPSEEHGSNCAYAAAMGYVRGICGVEPKAKPNAWCASFAADRLKELGLGTYA